jgi:hypothetical protein
VRVTASVFLAIGLGVAGIGGWQLLNGGAQLLIWVGGALALVAAVTLQKMAAVSRRAARRPVSVVTESTAAERVSPPLHDQGRASWTPRPLPEPLVAVAGSAAQIARAEIDAQQALRRAARVAALRERAEEMAAPAPVPLPAAKETSSPYARMGFVDDAEIEQHVRQLLERRAAG